MKRIIRVLGIILLITVLTANISYANTITIEQLNASIEKLFSKDIKIETNSGDEFGTSTGTTTIQRMNVKIEENKIILTEEDSNIEFIINYAIEDNVCKFESSVDLQIDEDSTEGEALYAILLLIQQVSNLEVCYLAVADALGIDLSLACTYFAQNSSESTDVENDIFSEKVISAEESSEIVNTVLLEVNLLELSKLDESKIDKSSYSTVTLVEPNEEEQLEGEEQNPPVNEEEKELPVDEDNEEVKTDDTLADKDIPKAGVKNAIYGIGIILILVFVLYLKNKKYRDIK